MITHFLADLALPDAKIEIPFEGWKLSNNLRDSTG